MSGISFVVNARSSLAICRAIQSQNCLLLRQFWRRYCNWAFGKQFWIFLCGCSQRAVDNFNFCTEDLLTDLFIDKDHYCNHQRNLGEEWSKDTTKHRKEVNYMEYTSSGSVIPWSHFTPILARSERRTGGNCVRIMFLQGSDGGSHQIT